MKKPQALWAGIVFVLGLIFILHAQETAPPVPEGADDVSGLSDLEVELKAVEMTTPVPAADVPEIGTFWSAQHAPGTAEEWPPLPGNWLALPVWEMDTNFFLVDDLNYDYTAAKTPSATKSGGLRAMDLSGTFAPMFSVPDYSTNLWLQITNLTGNTAGILISNTEPDIEYEIQGMADLTDTNWISEGFVLGSEITNWTPASVAATNYPNLFLRVRSWADDGSGLPIWWQLQNFGTTGVDPNGDPMGDGWSNIQKFQNGMNPNLFSTPSAPQGLAVVYDSTNDTAEVSWQSSPAPVTGYTVEDSDGATFSFSAGTEDFEDNLSADFPNGTGDPTIYKTYQVQAHYAGGDSAWSAPVSLETFQGVSAAIIAAQTNVNLVVYGLPTGTVAIRLTKFDPSATGFGDTSYNTNGDIPVANFTNGMYALPAFWAPVVDAYDVGEDAYFLQTVSPNGNVSAATSVENDAHFFGENPTGGESVLSWPAPFFDGRAQLKQNLIFQLRAATVDFPFAFYNYQIGNYQYPFGEITYPVTYVYAGFFGNFFGFDEFKPIEDNYLYRNFVFDASELDGDGRTTTGVGGDYDVFPNTLTLEAPAYQFDPPATFSTTLATVLNTSQWLASYALDSRDDYLGEIGITNISGTYFMASNAKNYWGLPFLSAKIGYGSGLAVTLTAGGNTTQGGYFYPETAQPEFQTAEYDFWNSSPLPGSATFSTTNKSDLLVTSVGNPNFNIAGYAKLSVQNGYSGVYGYLGQYFDQAYEITNGIVTTNVTGVLSSYGQFFATEPGPVALVTMPDIDTGERGTCTVYAVSLQLDANHDGIMDLSFNGVDATSQANPMKFWINNDYDRGHVVDVTPISSDFEQDDLQVADCPRTPNQDTPDCNFLDISGNRVIPSTRDLEDFARLWVCGVTSNLLAALPSDSTVTLSWGDVGSPNSSNPTIDLFQATDADGAMGYLTNSTIAANQIDPTQSGYVGRIGPGQSIQLNANFFGSTWRGDHFIWCGVSNGTGGLNLTIADGSGNVLAQATTYIQIKDIKQMYERWTVGDNPSKAPTNTAYLATEELPVGASAFQYTLPQDTNTPYILFVHGWNMATWDKDRFAETAFKRLYWQGYQGRFGLFRWPTLYAFPAGEMSFQAFNPDNFDTTEFQAWQSGAPLRKLLVQLNNEYPGQVRMFAHSHGNIAAGEALRTNVTLVHTYVAMQAAVPSHAYDPTTTNRFLGVWDSSTPERTAQYWTNGAPCYFKSIAGAAHFANFYNFNDWALGWWMTDQNTKPDAGYEWTWEGTNAPELYTYTSPLLQVRNLYLPTDTYEIFSYITEGRCFALGQQVDVGGVFDKTLEVDLFQSPYSFGSAHKGHSAEFRSDNMSRSQFWSVVLKTMDLKP